MLATPPSASPAHATRPPAFPAPTKRDFNKLIFKPGDGSITYHFRPAGY